MQPWKLRIVEEPGVVGTTQIGEHGERYEILRELGRGGMATVYLARQLELDRYVALKEMAAAPGSDPTWAQRFLREARMGGSLSHPNIVTVYDYFVRSGTPYIAMEYVEGGSLRPHVGHLTLAQIGGVLEGLLAGLAHAEAHKIVHRDLKPENLMVTAEGRIKIADFGIGKATTDAQTGFHTQTGMAVGTPHYMAPEQAMATKTELGTWTDLYSVGCIAFELFTKRVPFHGTDGPMAILLRHINETIPPITTVAPEIDERLSDWVATLVVTEPKQRAQSAQPAWDELEDILLSLLGPRWRREARLILPPADAAEAAKPLTPAAFERPPDDENDWGAPDSAPPVEAAPSEPTPPPEPEPEATVPPQAPPPSPPPAPSEPRRRSRVWVLAVVLAAIVVGAAAFMLRPDGDHTTESPPPESPRPTTFTTRAFSVRMPAGWDAVCVDQAGRCSNQPVPAPTRRSALIKGGGTDPPRITIDRTPASPTRSVSAVVDSQERALADLADYQRAGPVRTDAVSPTRRARAFSFTSSDPAFHKGAVYVFEAAGDIYVVTATAPAGSRELARTVATSLRTR